MTEEPKRRCFVILPFSKTTEKHTEEYWNKHYNEFLPYETYPYFLCKIIGFTDTGRYVPISYKTIRL